MKAKVSLSQQEGELQISSKEVRDFFDMIIPSTIKELGGIAYDNVKLWRFKNQVRVAEIASAYAKQYGLTVSPVSLKLLAPLLEGASLEEEASMQEKWAAMLINAASKSTSVEVPYPNILKELSVTEVRLLDWLYDEGKTHDIQTQAIIDQFDLQEKELELITDNLVRLRLWSISPQYHGIPIGERVDTYDYEPVKKQGVRVVEGVEVREAGYYILSFTNLGRSFVRSCKFPPAPNPA